MCALLMLGRAADALLFGLSGYDPAVLGITAGVIGGVVFAAGFFRREVHRV